LALIDSQLYLSPKYIAIISNMRINYATYNKHTFLNLLSAV
jgi:hypothetical protein